MRNRPSSLWGCIPIVAILSAGCTEQTQSPTSETEKPPPVYAGGSKTPPTTSPTGKTIKNPKIINMTPNSRIVP